MVSILVAELPVTASPGLLELFRKHLRGGFLRPTGYRQPEKILACMAGRLLCQKLFLEMGIGENVWDSLQQDTYGKWSIGAAVDFNVSHAGSKVVAAITDHGQIGIDIEKIRKIDVQEYEECFSHAEWRYVQEAAAPERFFQLWTKKESLTKTYGLGLQVPLATVAINGNTGEIINTSMHGYFYELHIAGYCGYLCTSHPGQKLKTCNLGAIERPDRLK